MATHNERSMDLTKEMDDDGARSRMPLNDDEKRARRAHANGAKAFERLLRIAEGSGTGQASKVAEFVAATVGHVRFDMFNLRAVDLAISDDILICLEVIRWGKFPITHLVADGQVRVERVSYEWNYRKAALTEVDIAYLRHDEHERALRL